MYSALHMDAGIQSQVHRLPKSASALIGSPSPQPHHRLLLGIVKTSVAKLWVGDAGLASKHRGELSFGALLS